jgi:hypothetical protein
VLIRYNVSSRAEGGRYVLEASLMEKWKVFDNAGKYVMVVALYYDITDNGVQECAFSCDKIRQELKVEIRADRNKKGAGRVTKIIALQPSPEQTKKKQEDADRAMKELLEEEEKAAGAAGAASVKKKQAKTDKLSRRHAAEGQDVSQKEEHAKEHTDAERTEAKAGSEKKKTEIVATSAVAAAPAAPKNKFEKPGEEEEERNQVAAERKEDDAGFQVIQRKTKSKKKNAGDQGASASKTAPWATASKEAGAAAAREGAKSKSCPPPLLAEVEQAGGGDAAAAAGAPLGARLYAISSMMSAGEAESLFWSRFNFSPSDASSRAAETAACTSHLRPAAAPEEAPAPAESMSRAAPAAGAVARFVSESFQCPLTMEVMRDPVITADGQTYERTEIEKWFALGNRTSPLTGEALPSTNLIPNIALRNAIQDAGA